MTMNNGSWADKMVMRGLKPVVAVIVFLLTGGQTAHAQAVWQRQAGISNVILFKDVLKTSYYCTWAISVDGPARALFDAANEPGTLTQFRIRWPTDLVYGVDTANYLKLIVNRDMWLFYIVKVNREAALTDVTSEFSQPLSSKMPLEQALENAKSLRIYLPNGVFKDVDTSGFPAAIGLLKQCRREIADLNGRNP